MRLKTLLTEYKYYLANKWVTGKSFGQTKIISSQNGISLPVESKHLSATLKFKCLQNETWVLPFRVQKLTIYI